LSGRGLCDELITRPEESYRLCCVVACDLETSRTGAPYIYDISSLKVNIICPSTPGSSEWSLPHRFPHQNPVRTPLSHSHATCPSLSIFSILSPKQYLVSSTHHTVPYYVAFSTPLLVTSSLQGSNISQVTHNH